MASDKRSITTQRKLPKCLPLEKMSYLMCLYYSYVHIFTPYMMAMFKPVELCTDNDDNGAVDNDDDA